MIRTTPVFFKQQISLMHFFLMLILCVYCKKFFAYEQDWSDFDSTDVLGENSDLFSTATIYDNDLWDTSSTTSVDSDDDLLFVSSRDCGSSASPLGRRASETCTNEQTDDKKPSLEIRPLRRTKDAPLLPVNSNYDICLPDLMGYSRNFAMCDSGLETDRHPTSEPGVFDLTNCDLCAS